jgi:hypothetical protein
MKLITTITKKTFIIELSEEDIACLIDCLDNEVDRAGDWADEEELAQIDGIYTALCQVT